MNRAEIIREVRSIILRYSRPTRIYLYGSSVNGEMGERSDIDIAYDDENISYLNMQKIKDEIDKLPTLLKIDIKNIAKAQKRFRNRVISSGKVLYSATKYLRAEDGLYNFSNALNRFSEAIHIKDELYREGFSDIYLDILVKRFEFTYEMAWKALKRYLDYLGFDAKSPRGVFKEAYAQGILDEEQVWLDMIEMRNLSSHIYDESEISTMVDEAKRFLKAFEALRDYLEDKLKEED